MYRYKKNIQQIKENTKQIRMLLGDIVVNVA